MKLQQMIEQVQKHHPDLGTVEIINLLNQASDEFCQRTLILDEATKFNTVANQMWYSIGDDASDSSNNKLEANKIFRIDLMDNEGDYIQIPRLIDKNILLMDATSEPALDVPDGD